MYTTLVPCIKFVSQIKQVTLNALSLERGDATNSGSI